MKKNHYLYPAILTYDGDGISVEFPDIPGCLTCGDTTEEAFKNAKEALELHMYGIEEENNEIPISSNPTDFKLESNQTVVLIDVWMIPVRDYMLNKSIKKTLTLPKWLNDIAEENKVNFSYILQTALKEYLGLEKRQ